MGNDSVAQQENDEQSDDQQRNDDVCQPVVACQHVAVGTYDSQAPFRSCHRLVAYQAWRPVDIHHHLTFLACRHFVS